MNLTLQTLKGKKSTVVVPGNATVGDLKLAVVEQAALASTVAEQKLIAKGKVLVDDNQPLSSSVKDGDTVVVMLSAKKVTAPAAAVAASEPAVGAPVAAVAAVPVAGAPVPANAEALERMTAMGFSLEIAQRALEQNHGDEASAIDQLVRAPMLNAPPAAIAVQLPEALAQLIMQGQDQQQPPQQLLQMLMQAPGNQQVPLQLLQMLAQLGQMQAPAVPPLPQLPPMEELPAAERAQIEQLRQMADVPMELAYEAWVESGRDLNIAANLIFEAADEGMQMQVAHGHIPAGGEDDEDIDQDGEDDEDIDQDGEDDEDIDQDGEDDEDIDQDGEEEEEEEEDPMVE